MLKIFTRENSFASQQAQMNIKMVVSSEEAAEGAKENLSSLLSDMRINFQYHVLVSKGESFWKILSRESEESDLVMLM